MPSTDTPAVTHAASKHTAGAGGLAGFKRVCSLDDIWQGEAMARTVDGVQVLLCHTDSGEVHAVQANCPHQAVPLEGGSLEGDVITCPMHLWRMNVATGEGVNPCHAKLSRYPVKVVDGEIWIAELDREPAHCRP